jgi:hypothetical protein
MALTRPALEILGISPNFSSLHPPDVVVSIAEAIYRTAVGKYHPDKAEAALPVPEKVNLSELQEARDAVRADVAGCIRELTKKESAMRGSKELAGLKSRIDELEHLLTKNGQVLGDLWTYVAYQKIGLELSVKPMLENTVAHSVQNLNGFAVLVAKSVPERHCTESCCVTMIVGLSVRWSNDSSPRIIRVHQGYRRNSYINRRRLMDLEVVTMIRKDPMTSLDQFDLLGSYDRGGLATARRKKEHKSGEDGDRPSTSISLGGFSTTDQMVTLETALVQVLKPAVVVGNTLIAVRAKGEKGMLRRAGFSRDCEKTLMPNNVKSSAK